MTTPATKPTRSRKAATMSESTRKAALAKTTTKRASKSSAALVVVPELSDADPVVETKPARKRAAKAAAVVETPVVETPAPKRSAATLSDEQSHELTILRGAALAAVEAFEARVIELIESGVSPTTIGKAVELGNSSIRRIAMRRSPGLVK